MAKVVTATDTMLSDFYERTGIQMNINISYDSEQPLCEQIEQCIKQAVFAGELVHNEHLPSVRQLSADLNVSAITVKRAYADLEHEGFIYTLSGRGTFVKIDNLEYIMSEHKKQILCELHQMAARCRDSGVTLEETEEILREV